MSEQPQHIGRAPYNTLTPLVTKRVDDYGGKERISEDELGFLEVERECGAVRIRIGDKDPSERYDYIHEINDAETGRMIDVLATARTEARRWRAENGDS